MNLPEQIVAVHVALTEAAIPHAFGGALSLAWCTQQARGTNDIDVNVFVAPDRAVAVLTALADIVTWTDDDRETIERDGQVRLHWDKTPIDLFFNTTEFHELVASRTRREPFLGHDLPFLSCRDLAVFKAFFNRTQDWADLEAMQSAGTLEVDAVVGVLVRLLGPGDDRVARLLTIART